MIRPIQPNASAGEAATVIGILKGAIRKGAGQGWAEVDYQTRVKLKGM
ncbi:MAG: hypothetical protein WD768_17470 [Phycisphaeraceae bacterium]